MIPDIGIIAGACTFIISAYIFTRMIHLLFEASKLDRGAQTALTILAIITIFIIFIGIFATTISLYDLISRGTESLTTPTTP